MKYSTKALIETISIPDIYIECFIATDGHEKEIKQGIMLYNKFPERLLNLYVTWADVNNPADEEFCIAQFTNVMWGPNETRKHSMTVRRLKHPWRTSLLKTTGTFQTYRRFAMFVINVRITGKGFLVIAESMKEHKGKAQRLLHNTGNAEHHTIFY